MKLETGNKVLRFSKGTHRDTWEIIKVTPKQAIAVRSDGITTKLQRESKTDIFEEIGGCEFPCVFKLETPELKAEMQEAKIRKDLIAAITVSATQLNNCHTKHLEQIFEAISNPPSAKPFLTKPENTDKVIEAIDRAIELHAIIDKNKKELEACIETIHSNMNGISHIKIMRVLASATTTKDVILELFS